MRYAHTEYLDVFHGFPSFSARVLICFDASWLFQLGAANLWSMLGSAAVQAIQMAEPSGVQADFAAPWKCPTEPSAQLQIHAFDAFQWIYLNKHTHTHIYIYVYNCIYIQYYTYVYLYSINNGGMLPYNPRSYSHFCRSIAFFHADGGISPKLCTHDGRAGAVEDFLHYHHYHFKTKLDY